MRKEHVKKTQTPKLPMASLLQFESEPVIVLDCDLENKITIHELTLIEMNTCINKHMGEKGQPLLTKSFHF
jgi:hypothetical protein